MSARDKGVLTKDSVSLLPCFYFVEVSLGSELRTRVVRAGGSMDGGARAHALTEERRPQTLMPFGSVGSTEELDAQRSCFCVQVQPLQTGKQQRCQRYCCPSAVHGAEHADRYVSSFRAAEMREQAACGNRCSSSARVMRAPLHCRPVTRTLASCILDPALMQSA